MFMKLLCVLLVLTPPSLQRATRENDGGYSDAAAVAAKEFVDPLGSEFSSFSVEFDGKAVTNRVSAASGENKAYPSDHGSHASGTQTAAGFGFKIESIFSSTIQSCECVKNNAFPCICNVNVILSPIDVRRNVSFNVNWESGKLSADVGLRLGPFKQLKFETSNIEEGNLCAKIPPLASLKVCLNSEPTIDTNTTVCSTIKTSLEWRNTEFPIPIFKPTLCKTNAENNSLDLLILPTTQFETLNTITRIAGKIVHFAWSIVRHVFFYARLLIEYLILSGKFLNIESNPIAQYRRFKETKENDQQRIEKIANLGVDIVSNIIETGKRLYNTLFPDFSNKFPFVTKVYDKIASIVHAVWKHILAPVTKFAGFLYFKVLSLLVPLIFWTIIKMTGAIAPRVGLLIAAEIIMAVVTFAINATKALIDAGLFIYKEKMFLHLLPKWHQLAVF